MKKVMIFHPFLIASGGSERITLEEEKYLKSRNILVKIVTFDYKEKNLFNNNYRPEIAIIGKKKILLFKIISRIIELRKFIVNYKPDYIDVCNVEGCLYMYLATTLTKYKYFTQIPSSGYDNFDIHGKHLMTYFWSARIFHKGYKKIRNLTESYKKILPEKFPKLGIKYEIISNIVGILSYLAVRKASKVFVLSNRVKYEIKQLYGKDAKVLKGAYPENLKNYKPKNNIKKLLNIEDKKILLSICRLEPKKRVDLTINAFNLISRIYSDVILIIGGTGSSENYLKILTKEFKLDNKVIFIGFIPDNTLFDYYYYCDVFVSADIADYDITIYTAIGFNKNIVCTNDYEFEPELLKFGKIFLSNINENDFAKNIKKALKSKTLTLKYNYSNFSWEYYFNKIYGI